MTTKAPAATSLVDTLIDIGTIASRALALRLRALKLSSAQLRILEALDAERVVSGEGLQPSALAAMLIQEPQSASGLLNRLEDRGLVWRDRDNLATRDRRAVWAKITSDGMEAVAQAREQRATLERRVVELMHAKYGAPVAVVAWRDALRGLLASDILTTAPHTAPNARTPS